MNFAFDMHDPMDDIPMLDKPLETPTLGWRDAYAQGRQLMNEVSVEKGFKILNEESFSLSRAQGVYYLSIHSSKDINKGGGTTIVFSANTGKLKGVYLHSEASTGLTIATWLTWLHMALVFGLPMQILVSVMGIVIVTLSVTGVVIWLRKRSARKRHELKSRSRPTDAATTNINCPSYEQIERSE
jgi:uncharacterized iron-regulated membrane protein